MFASGRIADGVRREVGRIEVELLRKVGDDRGREWDRRVPRPAREAQMPELDRKAELIFGPAAARDDCQILLATPALNMKNLLVGHLTCGSIFF